MGVEVMRRWILPVVLLNLLILIALVFVYPQLMVSPGPLRPAHAKLTTDCFACHSPFAGASAERCLSCHALKDIGLRTTAGAPLATGKWPAFHQQLASARCMDCHTEHQNTTLGQVVARPAFSHELLNDSVRSECKTCHQPPDTAVHANTTLACSQCHDTNDWRPSSFDHRLLAQADLQHCATCHMPPTNDLHKGVGDACGSCHQTAAWKPTTFDHGRFFALEGVHDTPCATCHVNHRYDTYTCYGCHAHDPARVIQEHREEGIVDIKNCVRCHRSARGENGAERERD